ncbi:hypothetical protein BDP55DRAFT_399973 [Colletotrichum godetiae]|uniref:Uncharacterized protein n=1 Tax=Colletotrichum godetiae TaxID=1209918 RepID=A0AAJ0EM66_9PEZI|nr:uncharacterized protein BDP55DRAFT_399973 [Colletotrichum godetiae]KAK1658350.1 hypothetical protein BDP55DRAFT_399973 [Colletotrichum godetiae]
MPNFLCLDFCICQQWARSRKGRSASLWRRLGLDSRRKSGFWPNCRGQTGPRTTRSSSGKGRYRAAAGSLWTPGVCGY